MRKIIFLMSVFFLCILNSCANLSEKIEADEEIITVSLPKWPPEDNLTKHYPILSRWKISIMGRNFSHKFFFKPETSEHPQTFGPVKIFNSTLTFPAKKNLPVAVIAQPITENGQGEETVFFKPAGLIYPGNTINQLSWENGFIATLMTNIYENEKVKNNHHISSTFNWKKAAQVIADKITNGLNSTKNYNPWLLSKSNILNKISSKKFSSAYFTLSSSYNYIPELSNKVLLSSFIPNNSSSQGKTVLLKKSLPEIFMYSPDSGIIITYNSPKKVSVQHIFLPIFKEEL